MSGRAGAASSYDAAGGVGGWPLNWLVVGYGEHPVPTNVEVASGEVERLRAVSARIREQAARLRAAGDSGDSWKSDAADRFRTFVQELPGQLDVLADRYARVSGSLAEFVAVAAGTKRAAEEGLAAAEQALREREEADQHLKAKAAAEQEARRQAERLNAADPGAPPRAPVSPPGPWAWQDCSAVRDAANRRYIAAKIDVSNAVQRFNAAADQACTQIEGAINDSLTNESGPLAWIKRAGNWLSEHLPIEKINSIASTIAGVAGMLALFVPGPWSVAFAAVAFAAAMIVLISDVVQLTAKSHRGESISGWDYAQIGLDALAVVPAAGATAKATIGVTRMESMVSVTFRGSRAIDFVEHGGSVLSAAKNTYLDVTEKHKSVGQALLDPGSVLWAGAGVAAGEGLKKAWPGERLAVGGGMTAEKGELMAERVKVSINGAGAAARGGGSLRDLQVRDELPIVREATVRSFVVGEYLLGQPVPRFTKSSWG